jgi:ketosteroid isomerase-like protein
MKNIITLFLAFIALYSCNNSNQKGNTIKNHEEIVKQYFEHFNNHDWIKMANMYIDTAAFKDPNLGTGIVKQTRQQIVEKYSGLAYLFPDVKDKVLHTYSSGDNHIIVEFVSSGTAPDNSTFELPICTIFTIENGLITKDFTYFDNVEEAENDNKK